MAARAAKIEKRKGLAAGEGAKVLENRKTRRRELFNTPEAGAGKFTEKYAGKPAGEKLQDEASEDTSMKIANNVEKQLKPKSDSSYFDQFLTGGGIDTTQKSPDRSNQGSNALDLYRKKKGY